MKCAGQQDLSLDKSLIVDLNLQNAGHEGGYQLTRQLLQTGKTFTARWPMTI